MRILEQILEEIEKEAYRPDVGRKQAEGLERAMKIIRSHMEDDGWIPVEELLPEKPIPVWVTRKMCTGCYVSVDTYHTGKWQYYDDSSVIAWMPKDNTPEPYRPKEE